MSTMWSWSGLAPLAPEIFLAVLGMVLLVKGAICGERSARMIGWVAFAGVVMAAVLLCRLDWNADASVLHGMAVLDKFGGFMKLLTLGGMAAVLALSVPALERNGLGRPEFAVLCVFACLGMMIMISATSLLSLYVGLELQSLSIYVLAAMRRDHVESSEAGLKYFVLGALASGMLLFGISLVYGFTGAIDYAGIDASLRSAPSHTMPMIFGLVFLVAAVAFKISAVPFHMWTPDVYEGAPTPVTALMAIVPKVAALAMLMRLLFQPFGSIAGEWQQIVGFLAAASMIWSAFAALAQTNIKRLMAYSSIGNMGYALLGVTAGSADGVGAVLVYMSIYMAMTAGVFTIILSMKRGGAEVLTIGDLAGLSRTRPCMAYAMAILMFSMSGIPPLAGFFGKLAVFEAAVASGFYTLAVIGVLTSVVAAYYYLRIVKLMFFDEPAPVFDADRVWSHKGVLALSVAFVLAFVVMPGALFEAGRDSAAVLFNS